jgi:hypothetical protein
MIVGIVVRASRPVAANRCFVTLRPPERFPVVNTGFNVKTRGPRLDMLATESRDTSETDMTARLMPNSALECSLRASTNRASAPALSGRKALESMTAPFATARL